MMESRIFPGVLFAVALALAVLSPKVASGALVKSDRIKPDHMGSDRSHSEDVIGQVVEFEQEIQAVEGKRRPGGIGIIREGATGWDDQRGEPVQGEQPRHQQQQHQQQQQEEGHEEQQEMLLWPDSRSGAAFEIPQRSLPDDRSENGSTGGTREMGRSWWRWDAGKGELVQREGPEGLANGQETLLWLPEIVYEDLELMDLRYFLGLHCPAPVCPSFSRCRTGRRQAGRVLACNGSDSLLSDSLSDSGGSNRMALVDAYPVLTSPPPNHVKENASYDVAVAEPFAAQVFLLENAFINDRGMVFDGMYHYRHGLLCRSCPLDFGLYTGNETKVHVYSELLSLANWNGGNFYHSLLEVMPSLLYLRPFLEAKPDIPIPMKIDQDKHAHMFSLIGINSSTLNFKTVRKDHLFFARRLLLPSIAQCGRPAAALVRHLRNHYLLPPSAPRIKSRDELAHFSGYASDTALDSTDAPTGGGGGAAAAAPDASTAAGAGPGGAGVAAGAGVLAVPDWCVVVGQRDTTRRIVGRTHILEELEAFFPKERIVVFRGDLPLPEAKQLFNRARLFITPHGALMANMVFMPPGGFVLEARPEEFNNNLYDYLAYVSDLHYYLVKGVGSKDTDIRVDMEEMVGVVDVIAKKLIAQGL
ncbi:hypothetical protein CLOM_g13616 [Closterium sp. NIES-68]|nr:hypothetical protein CLOM_g13616 [Closterium sp. NIES-68]GJP77103.1 hypothetical protein CLOP_g7545 [Closterium sp. NIES-67]